MTDNKLIAVRDQYGFRPLAIGKMDGGWVVASESCAFDLVGAEFVRDVEPGEMLVFENDHDEPKSSRWAENMPAKRAHCVFEYVYLRVPTALSTNSLFTRRASIWAGNLPKKQKISRLIL